MAMGLTLIRTARQHFVRNLMEVLKNVRCFGSAHLTDLADRARVMTLFIAVTQAEMN